MLLKKIKFDPITVKEAMEILGCSRATIYNYIRKGYIEQRRNRINQPVLNRIQIEGLKEVS